jgi:phospholipase/carboxylesterase
MNEISFYEHSECENPKYLVIFLHGYGANGQNLLSLSEEFIKTLPQAHFIAPNAVEPWEGEFPDCYQWFSLYGGIERKSFEDIADNIRNSNQILKEFIHEQLQRFNLTFDKLFLIGFSQGAMMANYQGLVAKEKLAGIISFSGKVILPELTGEKTNSKPEICLIHGEDDAVVPIENLEIARNILEDKGINFEIYPLNDLDHAIDIRGVEIAKKFIAKRI